MIGVGRAGASAATVLARAGSDAGLIGTRAVCPPEFRAETLGRTTQVWTIRIEDDAGKLICLSRTTAAVIARG